MKKKKFEEIKERYEREKKRLEQISKGDFVWERVPRVIDFDYHPAIVKSINVDEDYIDVIDVTRNNKEMRYESFVTETEMLQEGFTKNDLEKTYCEYSGIREKIMDGIL